MEELAGVWDSHNLGPCCTHKLKLCLVLPVDSEAPLWMQVVESWPLDSVIYPEPRVAREEKCLSWTTAAAFMVAVTTFCHLTTQVRFWLSDLRIVFNCKISPSTISTAHRLEKDPLLLLTAWVTSLDPGQLLFQARPLGFLQGRESL